MLSFSSVDDYTALALECVKVKLPNGKIFLQVQGTRTPDPFIFAWNSYSYASTEKVPFALKSLSSSDRQRAMHSIPLFQYAERKLHAGTSNPATPLDLYLKLRLFDLHWERMDLMSDKTLARHKNNCAIEQVFMNYIARGCWNVWNVGLPPWYEECVADVEIIGGGTGELVKANGAEMLAQLRQHVAYDAERWPKEESKSWR